MMFEEHFTRADLPYVFFKEIGERFVVYIYSPDTSRPLDSHRHLGIRIFHYGGPANAGGAHSTTDFTAEEMQEFIGYDLTRFGARVAGGTGIAREVVEDIVAKLCKRVGITLEPSKGGICMVCKLYDAYAAYSEKYHEVRCYRHCE